MHGIKLTEERSALRVILINYLKHRWKPSKLEKHRKGRVLHKPTAKMYVGKMNEFIKDNKHGRI